MLCLGRRMVGVDGSAELWLKLAHIICLPYLERQRLVGPRGRRRRGLRHLFQHQTQTLQCQ